MANLQNMPPLTIDSTVLADWGQKWFSNTNPDNGNTKKTNAFDRHQSVNFGYLFDQAVGEALAEMLGNIPIRTPSSSSLLPPEEDCVEVGTSRVVGGIRPQNYDAVYRPDGIRVAFDSKSLNDQKSIGKNWQNMVNDLATEASTVHIRFPQCVVAFIVILPAPALTASQGTAIIRTLERMSGRRNPLDPTHLAEAISLLVWDPTTGHVDNHLPAPHSTLRIENFSEQLSTQYFERYKGLPPHD